MIWAHFAATEPQNVLLQHCNSESDFLQSCSHTASAFAFHIYIKNCRGMYFLFAMFFFPLNFQNKSLTVNLFLLI